MTWAIRISSENSPFTNYGVSDQSNDNSLTHYGVKGMKWGVRKEYEKKGRKSKSLSGTKVSRDTGNGISVTEFHDYDDKKIRREVMDLYSESGMTPAEYASENVALYKFKNLPRFNMRLSEEQQRQAVNHNAPNYNRQMNCFECTMAYEMRRRGYNVQANEVNGGFALEVFHAFDIKNSFDISMSSTENSGMNSRVLAHGAYDELEKKCLAYGNGARGMLGMYYAEPYDGGHAMSWVVEDGKFKIIDNQSNKQVGYETFLMCDGEINVYRLDNAEVLPGVTDFVEPFEATAEEKKEAQDRYKRGQKIWKKEHQKTGKDAVAKVIKNIGKNVGDFVKKGAEVVKKLFSKASSATKSFFDGFKVQKNSTRKSGDAGMRAWEIEKKKGSG